MSKSISKKVIVDDSDEENSEVEDKEYEDAEESEDEDDEDDEEEDDEEEDEESEDEDVESKNIKTNKEEESNEEEEESNDEEEESNEEEEESNDEEEESNEEEEESNEEEEESNEEEEESNEEEEESNEEEEISSSENEDSVDLLEKDFDNINLNELNSLGENYRWNVVKSFFEQKGIVDHQISTFDNYLITGIQRVVQESSINMDQKDMKYKVTFGDVYIPPYPTIIEENRKVRKLYPSEARLRDLNYDSPIFVDIKEELQMDDQPLEIVVHKRILIGRTPIMLNSEKCSLRHCSQKEKIDNGECENDPGGYFIIKGKERVLVGQLRGVYNQQIVMLQKPDNKYKYICEVRSMSEETGHSVLIQAKVGMNDRTVVFSLPYVKDDIPVGIVFKALGYTEEKDIQNLIGYSEELQKYVKYIFRDSFFIKNQEEALKYIGQFSINIIKDDKRKDYAWQVIENEILPHMGISSSIKEKAYFLGSMINKLLLTHVGLRQEDDRDNYVNKRVEMAGVLCCELFRTLFKRFTKAVEAQLEKKKQRPDVLSIISRTNSITLGLKLAFATGNWGVQKNNYIRTGVSQVLSRMTYGATLSHLRRVVIPIGKEGKNAKIRQTHTSQIMFICPNETPEGLA